MLNSRIMARIVNRPLLVLPSVAETIHAVIGRWERSEPVGSVSDRSSLPRASQFVGDPVVIGEQRGYGLVNGTAVVSVVGELVNRGAWIGADSGLVSYEGIAAQLTAAASDSRVSRILLDVESPGGEAIGAMELAATVRRINAEKPVFALVNGLAASAAYAMVSGASRIFTTQSGISGSIGVVLIHFDRSSQLEMRGIKPTLIFAGDHKVDGNPFGPLSDSVEADLQAEVQKFYGLFVDTVASGRSGLSREAIIGTQARTYIGADAVDAGLADAVSSFEDVMSEISRAATRSTVRKGGKSMSDTKGDPAATNAGITQADVDAASRSATERLTAIVTAEGISGDAGRTAVAAKMASTSSMSADEIVAFVKSTVPAATVNPTIAARLAGTGVNDVGQASVKSGPDVKINPTNIYDARLKARVGRGQVL